MLLCYVFVICLKCFMGLRDREAPFVLSQDVSVRG